MIWWALEQKRKRAAKAFEETWGKGQAEVIAKLLASDRITDKHKIEEWARKEGILPDKAPTARKCRGCCCCRCA